jgi:DNA polymerase-3 subunit delta
MPQVSAAHFSRFLDTDPDANIYLFYGEERFFYEELLARVIDHIFPNRSDRDLNLQQFYGTENSLGEILSACVAYPMFAGKKIVIAKEFDKLPINEPDSFISYINNPQPSTILILTAEKWGKTKFHQNILERSVAVNCKSLSVGDLYHWVEEKLKRSEMQTDRTTITFLIENIGNNLLRLNLEIEKLINFAGPGKKIDFDTVATVTGFTRDVSIFNFQKALGNRDLKKSMRTGIQLLEQGEVLSAILPMIVNFFRRIWVVKYLLSKNLNRNKILQELNGHPYAFNDIFASVGNFSERQIMAIMKTLEESELALKTSMKKELSILTMVCYHICKN